MSGNNIGMGGGGGAGEFGGAGDFAISDPNNAVAIPTVCIATGDKVFDRSSHLVALAPYLWHRRPCQGTPTCTCGLIKAIGDMIDSFDSDYHDGVEAAERD